MLLSCAILVLLHAPHSNVDCHENNFVPVRSTLHLGGGGGGGGEREEGMQLFLQCPKSFSQDCSLNSEC